MRTLSFQTSTMLLFLSGLFCLLLDFTFHFGQVEGGSLNQFEATTKSSITVNDTSFGFKASKSSIKYYCDVTEFHHLKLICLKNFNITMSGVDQWCDWEAVVLAYNELTECMKIVGNLTDCFYPNTMVQDFFVKIHEKYFTSCPIYNDALTDVPPVVVLVLTLIPITIMPFLIYMVIWKSSVE